MAGRLACALASGARFSIVFAFAGLTAFGTQSAYAQDASEVFDTSAGNLIVVLRESRGENKQDEALQPFGPVKVRLQTGRDINLETSWYQYLGDMHVRIVFDGDKSMQSATPEDLERLHLTPDAALRLGIGNLKRRYGEPTATPWGGGVMQVETSAPDLTSSWFFDRDFWQSIAKDHPDGVVVAVPRRGGLVYASAADEEAVDTLRFGAAAMYTGGPGTRLSSALYLFRDGRWSVYQAPMRTQ